MMNRCNGMTEKRSEKKNYARKIVNALDFNSITLCAPLAVGECVRDARASQTTD